jgi:hypothetical protein
MKRTLGATALAVVLLAGIVGCSRSSSMLPDHELAKLKGTAGRGDPPLFVSTFSVSLYNGSSWNIEDLFILVTAQGESRQFQLTGWTQTSPEFYPNGTVKNLETPSNLLAAR